MSTARPPFHANVETLAQLLAGEYAAARDRLAAASPAPGDFLRFTERHYLAWYLVELLDLTGLRPLFAADDLARIEQATHARQAKQALLIDELARLWPLFRQRGVDLMLLKGPYLAERFFGGARKRGFLDLDLLVRGEQLRAAERLLAELGYERLSMLLVSRRLTTRFTHGFDFARDGLRLDLHWSLGAHASYRIAYDRVWRACTSFRLGGDEMAVLSEEDTLFFHLLSLFEDLDRGAARMRSFVDVYAMLTALDARIDWPAFWETLRRERTARVCQAVLGLFFVLFDVENRFPRSATSVAPLTAQMRDLPSDERAALIEAPQGALRNKAWTAQLYECARPVTVAWWFLSLPFRLAVYHPGRWSRLRARVGARLRALRRRR